MTPDCEQFTVLDAQVIGGHMVLRVRYPSCALCSYEGEKILVYENVTPIEALKWSRIDPHFKDPMEKVSTHEAPAPSARFPASDLGWQRAITFAKSVGRDS